jgi:hypothetical protein
MFIGKQGALRLAVPAELILARGLMRSLNQPPVLYARAAEGRQQEVRDDKATVVMLPLAIADFRFWVKFCRKLQDSKVKELKHSMFCGCMPRRRRSGGSQTVTSRGGGIMGN